MKNNRVLNILVPVNFSETSLNSLETAIVLAKQLNAKLTLLNVVELSFMFQMGGGSYISPKTLDNLIDLSRERLNSLIKTIRKKHEFDCVPMVKVGHVPQSIVETAYDYNIDLIIMGTHSASGFKKFFFGSTAYRVVEIACCPVLTIPSKKKWVNFKKVLFPIRSVQDPLGKYDFFRTIIKKDCVSLEVLVLASTYTDAEMNLLLGLVKELIAKLNQDGIKASGSLRIGRNMAGEVLKMANYIDADMIVITATTDAKFKQFFIGSFTQRILNHAPGPVLSIRPVLRNRPAEFVIRSIHESLPTQIPLVV